MLTLCKLYVSENFRGQTTFSLEANTGKKKKKKNLLGVLLRVQMILCLLSIFHNPESVLGVLHALFPIFIAIFKKKITIPLL